MAKFTNEQRIEIYNKRKAGVSFSQLELEYGINRIHGRYLVRLIDRHGPGILRQGRNKHYSKEYKEKAINRVLIDGESSHSVAIDIGLTSLGILNSWIKSYIENGYNVVEGKRGRHAKEERSKERGRTAEGNRRAETAEQLFH